MGEGVGLIFPGQGSQYVGMGREFYDSFRTAREVFEEVSDLLVEDIASLCFQGPEDRLKLTSNTQPAILTVSIAIHRVLREEASIEPICMAGHSLGEYTALVAAGSLEFKDAVRVVRRRGQFMQEAVPEGVGAMAAIVGLRPGEVEVLCKEASNDRLVTPANYNSPDQTVISGHAEAVKVAMEMAKARGAKRVIPLQVSAPFHSPLMEEAGRRLDTVLSEVEFSPLKVPVISNVTAAPYPSHKGLRDALVRQVTSPVRWYESILRASEMGVRTFVEIGPKKVLTGLIRRIDRSLSAINVEDLKGLRGVAKRLGVSGT